MTAQSPAERQAALKARRAALGLVRLELWVRPEHRARVQAYAERMTQKKPPA